MIRYFMIHTMRPLLLAATLLIGACSPVGSGPASQQVSGEEQREAVIGLWQAESPMNGRFFSRYASIPTGIFRFSRDGEYFAGIEVDIDAPEGTAHFRAITRGRWTLVGNRVLINGADTEFELTDFQVPTLSDAEFYRRMDQWRDTFHEWPLNKTIIVKEATDRTLTVHDGDETVILRRAR